jgi:5-methylcytosine-specific restriction endonuclease McrA
MRARHRERRLAYPSQVRHGERNRQWRAKNPGYFMTWYEANKDVQREKARVRRVRNKHAIAAQSARRRLHMFGFKSEVATIDRLAVWERDDGICGLCAVPVRFEDMHLDHIKPIAKGGPHTFDNVQPAHPRCNRRKKDRELPKWAFAAQRAPR